MVSPESLTKTPPRRVQPGFQPLGRRGFSILAFPEGTRSHTGEMLPFRHGVFLMAIRAQALVVPISLYGTREMMKKGEPGLRPGTAHFVVHPAVSTDGLVEGDRGELADRVRGIIAAGLPGSRAGK